MLRMARGVSRKGCLIAAAAREILFVAIALLIVTVGVLATASRMHLSRQGSTWQTAMSSRMVECGSNDLAPAQTDDSRPSPPAEMMQATFRYFPSIPIEDLLPELSGAPQAHGLRAPPHV